MQATFNEASLAKVACRAASELDNLRLNRLTEFKAVPALIVTLKNIEESGKDMLDPGDAVVMNRAIINAGISTTIVKTDQLIKETDTIRKQLDEVVTNRDKSKPDDIIRLRTFCLELSKSAVVFARSLDDMEPQHPFRR